MLDDQDGVSKAAKALQSLEQPVVVLLVKADRRLVEAPESATGRYLKPLLDRATVKPVIVDAAPKKAKRSRKATSQEDELGLVAAK
jgi:hypothetical protein